MREREKETEPLILKRQLIEVNLLDWLISRGHGQSALVLCRSSYWFLPEHVGGFPLPSSLLHSPILTIGRRFYELNVWRKTLFLLLLIKHLDNCYARKREGCDSTQTKFSPTCQSFKVWDWFVSLVSRIAANPTENLQHAWHTQIISVLSSNAPIDRQVCL